jgi:hypothetical protein
VSQKVSLAPPRRGGAETERHLPETHPPPCPPPQHSLRQIQRRRDSQPKPNPMKPILAIDPGASGGLAWTHDSCTFACPMPEGLTAQADWIRSLAAGVPGITCTIERTGTYVPGNSGPAAATFARHCGHLEAILYVLGIPTTQVAPGVRQKHLGTLPKEKPDRKRAIREEMARRYPTLTVTLKTADALGILSWAMSTPSARSEASCGSPADPPTSDTSGSQGTQ